MNQADTAGVADRTKITAKVYDQELKALQVELCHLQAWVKAVGARIILVFEGRDAAGKGGIIKALTERVSPRVFRVVALPAPNEREKTELYFQRYFRHFPAASEVVVFDRSWYNRAGVEAVMGFCTEEERRAFLEQCPRFERYITDSGVILIKIWLEVGLAEQERRFLARIRDPLRQWKLSPIDLESYARWYDYSRARDEMLAATDSDEAPWFILPSDDKRRARLNGISHVLSCVPYQRIKGPEAKLPKRAKRRAYDDRASLLGRHFVEARY